MNIIKLILSAFPAFLVSMLLVVNPANASTMQSVDTAPRIAVVSVQPISKLTAPHLISATNPIIDQLGCSCANCVENKFQLLQGKLPNSSI